MRLSSFRRETYEAWNHVNRQPIIRATVNLLAPELFFFKFQHTLYIKCEYNINQIC